MALEKRGQRIRVLEKVGEESSVGSQESGQMVRWRIEMDRRWGGNDYWQESGEAEALEEALKALGAIGGKLG